MEDKDGDRNLLQVPRFSNLQFSSPSPSDIEVEEDVVVGDISEMGGMGYEQTLMYGRYTRDLGEELKTELKRQKILEKTRRKELRRIKTDLRYVEYCRIRMLSLIKYHPAELSWTFSVRSSCQN